MSTSNKEDGTMGKVRITVGELKRQLEQFDDDAELHFEELEFYRLKIRGPKVVQMEFNDPEILKNLE